MNPVTPRGTFGWIAALALVCGCASAPPRVRRCPTRRPTTYTTQSVEVTATGTSTTAGGSGGSSDSLIGATSPPSPPPAPVQPANEPRTSATSTGTSEPSSGEDDEEPCVPEPESANQPTPREGSIAAYQAQIERERQGMASGMTECRDICRAAGSICTAAAEICRLAGDADARCTRARGACVDAGRTRDGACPTCPPAR